MTFRHYGKFRNEEVILLGYKASMNHVMICRLTMLPGDEQAALRQIASSTYAQSNCDYLIPVLQTERHKSGSDWFTYLATRLHRNDGSVATLPLKEIQEMNPDQKAFFKGYGKTISEAGQKIAQEETSGLGHQIMGESASTTSQSISGQEVPLTPVSAPLDANAQMLHLLNQMAQNQARMNETLATLAEKVAPPKKRTVTRKKSATSRKKAAPRKTATVKKTDAKKSVVSAEAS